MTCYYPSGAVSGGYACWNSSESTDGYSPCCFNDAYCYSNGFCLHPGAMSVYRAGCTDQSWKSNSCTQRCQGGPIGGIYRCDNDNNNACVKSDCGTDNQFQIPFGSLLLSGPLATSVLAASGYTTRLAVASASGTESVVTVTVPTTIMGGASATYSSSPAGASGGASQAASTSTCPASASSYSTGTLAGSIVGIGLPLLIAFLAALFLLLRERRKNKALLSQSQSHSQDQKIPQNSHYHPAEMEHKPHGGFGGSEGRTEIDSTGNGRVELPGGDGGGSVGRRW